MAIDEMITELNKALPIDLLYFVVPHDDGKGYELREAGVVTAYVLEPESLRTAAAASKPQESSHQDKAPPPPPLPPVVASPSTETLPTMQEEAPKFEPLGNSEMVFAKPKSQTELLHERGLEIPPAKKKGVKGRKRKAAKADESAGDEERDISASDPRLRGRGSSKITSIKTATAAEAAQASKFGQAN